MSLKSKLKAYESFDGAHGPNHVLNVQRNALELAKHYPDVDPSMVRAAAIYQPRRKTPAFRRGDIRREVPVDTGAQMFYAEIS